MTDTADIVARLAQHRTLGRAPREELEWLAAHGEMRHAEPGDLLAELPEALDTLAVLLSGHFSIFVNHGAGAHKVMEWSGGDVTGLLPFSRMSKPIGDMIIDEACDVFVVQRQRFPELIRTCPTITEALVHVMVDRARQFRASELQDEKMMSLGRLSAGLAHELNNPASAVARSARRLADALAEAEAAARALGEARLSTVQLAAVEDARGACVVTPASALTTIERADRQDAIEAWLDVHGATSEGAAALAETAVTIDRLDALAAALDGQPLDAALRWVAAGCETRALASDIEKAAVRISNLVGAVKRYSYMDRALAPEAVDLAAGLNDSVTLLAHKARKKSAGIETNIDPDLPRVLAIGGELNQVWMNLIDNALDAVPEGGHVRISAARRLETIVVRIVDDGAGIPAANRESIFDPFFTTKPVGQGTGLGLDIARQLVRHNGGDIEVESQPGRTEFRVTLPIAAGVVSDAHP